MTAPRLETIFATVGAPDDDSAKPVYMVMPVPGYSSYLVGKDHEGHACLLVAGAEHPASLRSPIRLENLDAQFALRCRIRGSKDGDRTGTFTVIRCTSLDPETIRYFLGVCGTIMGVVGDGPGYRELASAVHRLAAIFRKLQDPSARPVTGLFGELHIIRHSRSPAAALSAWRVDTAARFDFAHGDVRIDVKAATGRSRTHVFSYDQCNPPAGTFAILASLFVEESPGGPSLLALIREIEERIAVHQDLALKLHETVTATLGAGLSSALATTYDAKLAASSLRWFDLRAVPGIRGDLPVGVSGVHFRSDLSAAQALPIHILIKRDPSLGDLLPD